MRPLTKYSHFEDVVEALNVLIEDRRGQLGALDQLRQAPHDPVETLLPASVVPELLSEEYLTAASIAELIYQPGMIVATGRSSADDGFLFCDGSAVSRTTYADLFGAISTAYGPGDGSTTFNLPDLQDRFPRGDSGSLTLGATGGAATVTLAEANLPAHTHSDGTLATDTEADHTHADGTLATDSEADHAHASGTYAADTSGAHTHQYSADTASNTTAAGAANRVTALTTGSSGSQVRATTNDGDHTHDVSGDSGAAGAHSHDVTGATAAGGSHSHDVTGATGSTGSGTAHDNVPPYQVVNYQIKT